MKFLVLFFTTLFILSLGYAKAELPPSTMNDIEAFSKKKLDSKKDLAETIKIIEILLVLDDEDPSRTAVILLSESYNKNSEVFEKALNAVRTPKNKKQLNEIQALLKKHFKTGNG